MYPCKEIGCNEEVAHLGQPCCLHVKYVGSEFDDWDDERDYLESDFYDREDDRERWTCLFPGQCCMPAEHTSDECHTAGMAAEYFRNGGR